MSQITLDHTLAYYNITSPVVKKLLSSVLESVVKTTASDSSSILESKLLMFVIGLFSGFPLNYLWKFLIGQFQKVTNGIRPSEGNRVGSGPSALPTYLATERRRNSISAIQT